MNIEHVVDKLSDILNMSVHHFDHRKFNKGYLQEIENEVPILVAYSVKGKF